MKLKVFLQLIILFFGLMISTCFASGAIEEKDAFNWANSKGSQILQILADKNIVTKFEALDKILYEDIDLDYASKFVMGKYWRTMSESQKEIYEPLFKRYISTLYKSYPLDIKEGAIDFSVDKVVPSKKGVEVWCSINLNTMMKKKEDTTGRFSVLFDLVKNNGKLQVRDLKIGESSLLLSFRQRFSKMLFDLDGEIDWFLEDLEAITIDNEEKNAQNLENAQF